MESNEVPITGSIQLTVGQTFGMDLTGAFKYHIERLCVLDADPLSLSWAFVPRKLELGSKVGEERVQDQHAVLPHHGHWS